MTQISASAIRQGHAIIQGEEKEKNGFGSNIVNSVLIKYKTYKQIICH